jgi:hypothetical protein
MVGALEDLLPAIVEKLADRSAWRGFRLAEEAAGHEYARLQCLDRLVAGSPAAEYVVAVHRFERGYGGAELHDHRYPFAVFPFAESSRRGLALYEMPWERRAGKRVIASGLFVVRSGEPYAIEDHAEVFHAVRSLRPHLSVVLSDATRLASRPNRLAIAELAGSEAEEIRRAAARWVPRVAG